MQKAQGESVTLDCTYTTSSADIGELDIEWSVVSPDTTKKDQMVRKAIGHSLYQWSDKSVGTALTRLLLMIYVCVEKQLSTIINIYTVVY